MVIGFKFVLVMTHIFHYCWTKKVVKQKVRRNVDIEMAKLDKAPQAENGGYCTCFGLTVLPKVLFSRHKAI